MKSKRLFTLVELIVVISIIMILAVVAFLYLNEWIGKSRDAKRISDMDAISKALQIYYSNNSLYPKPSDNRINIVADGTGNIIGYQGNLGNDNKDLLLINGDIKDPINGTFYTYRTNFKQDNFAILGFIEDKESYQSNTANSIDFSKLYPRVIGEAGVILNTSKTPVQNIPAVSSSGYIDIFNTTGTYRVYISSTDYLEGTGISLQSIIQFGDNGYSEPSGCPDGFIPVPGNKDFHQPGFCVAKYEMKQKIGTSGNSYFSGGALRNQSPTEICGIGSAVCWESISNQGGYTIRLDNQITSKADGLPIVNLNQATAIRACSQMGSGYHLITNNEYMTIARDIEQQPENWNSGIVGSGGIYRGKNYWFYVFGLNNNKNSLNCDGGETYTGLYDKNSLVQDANSKYCDIGGRNKRALKLSNGRRIRDLAGNVREHVNGKNTMNGTGYNTLNSTICNNIDNGSDANDSNGYDWYSWTYNSITDSFEQCNYTNGGSYSSLGPEIVGLNIGNGIGRIYSGIGTNTSFEKISVRGGGGSENVSAGIYSLNLSLGSKSQGLNVGFRCAK